MLWSAVGKLQSPENRGAGPCRRAVGGRRRPCGQGNCCFATCWRGQARQVRHAGGQRLACRSDAASSLVVGIGIIGNLAGYPILDPIAALIVGFMVAKMGWEFGWDAMHDLMDRAVDEQEVEAIRRTLIETPGVSDVHDVRTRKMGDMIVVDAHIEVDALITVEAGHDIAVEARQRVLKRHRVLNLMTHVDPWRPGLVIPPQVDEQGIVVAACRGRRRRSSSKRHETGHTRSTGCRRAGAVRESSTAPEPSRACPDCCAASGYSTASELPVVLK